MQGNDMIAINSPNPVIITKEDEEMIMKLLPFAEEASGEKQAKKQLSLKGARLKEILNETGITHDQLWQKSKQGLFKLKRSSPAGWYICPPPDPIPSSTLRSLARKLLTSSTQLGKGNYALHVMAYKKIKSKLASLDHDPDITIPQMIAKYYLVICLERTNSYYIFTKQKKGEALAKQIAAK